MAALVAARERRRYTCMDACGIGTRAASMQGSAGVEALRVPCTLRTTCVGAVCSQWPLGLDNGPSHAAHANSARTWRLGRHSADSEGDRHEKARSSHSLLDLSYSTHVG